MQLNDIIIVSVMVSDAYTITDTDLIPPKMADTYISIRYWCIPTDCVCGIEAVHDRKAVTELCRQT